MNPLNLHNPVHFLATGFGSGLLTPAPGTWGSLVGTLIAILLWETTACQPLLLTLGIVGFLIGIYLCEQTTRDLGIHDDGRIVWDEIVAIWLVFSCLPDYSPRYYALAFLSFRLFDIIKPFPIRWVDRHVTGGLGIMLDDLLAGLFALLTLYLINWSFLC